MSCPPCINLWVQFPAPHCFLFLADIVMVARAIIPTLGGEAGIERLRSSSVNNKFKASLRYLKPCLPKLKHFKLNSKEVAQSQPCHYPGRVKSMVGKSQVRGFIHLKQFSAKCLCLEHQGHFSSHVDVWPACMCMRHVNALPTEPSRGRQVLRNWSHRQS